MDPAAARATPLGLGRIVDPVAAALDDTPVASDRITPREPGSGRILGGRYRLSRSLGVGGFGVVFAAEDLQRRAHVAVKVLSPAAAQNQEMVIRFHREAIAAARARHPHIVEVLDFDVDEDGSQYIVMEHLHGRDLQSVLEETGRLPLEQALAIATQCARGLEAAHQVGVLHRDLKPANIFLVRDHRGESVKIIDFGISKLTRAAGDFTDVTCGSKVVGTPFYMAPEQATGADLDIRCDIYALGVVLFEMVVGDKPFTGRAPIEILTKHVGAPRVPPSSIRPELAGVPGLDALVLRAIATDRARRFATMAEVADALMACLRSIAPSRAEELAEITGELTEPAPSGRRAVTRRATWAAAAVMVAAAVTWLAWPRALASRPAPPVAPAAFVAPPDAEPAPEPVIEPETEPEPVIEVTLEPAPEPTPPPRRPAHHRRARAPRSAAPTTVGVEEW